MDNPNLSRELRNKMIVTYLFEMLKSCAICIEVFNTLMKQKMAQNILKSGKTLFVVPENGACGLKTRRFPTLATWTGKTQVARVLWYLLCTKTKSIQLGLAIDAARIRYDWNIFWNEFLSMNMWAHAVLALFLCWVDTPTQQTVVWSACDGKLGD